MLYVLEGCDGSGKSTLANQLARLLNAEIIHCSQYTPNDLYFFTSIVAAAENRNIIADRFCYGQFVYQEEGERPLESINKLHTLETKMLRNGAKVIYVYAEPEIIQERLLARQESIINKLNVEQVMERYKAVKKMSILPWIDWYTGGEF